MHLVSAAVLTSKNAPLLTHTEPKALLLLRRPAISHLLAATTREGLMAAPMCVSRGAKRREKRIENVLYIGVLVLA